MANTKRFFDDKHPWSETKDDLLSNYLTPFFSKVYYASRDGIVYVDAFAGPGRFKDGSIGSPLIAMEKYLGASRGKNPKRSIQFVFGERMKRLRNQLEANAQSAAGSVSYIKQPIIEASFGDAMERAHKVAVIGTRKPSTYFYYVDPFGVKDLRMAPILTSPNFMHTEALVNFNTVGFIRDACAALNVAFDAPDELEIYDEEFEEDTPDTERMQRLTAAIGSEDWKEIIFAKRDEQITFWEAEYLLGQLFSNNARSSYKYVTCMPIKDTTRMVSQGGEIKYRMVHMTNNAEGCLLMNTEMIRRNESQTAQPGLFRVDVDGRDVEEDVVARTMRDAVMAIEPNRIVNMSVLAAYVISRCGVFERDNALLKKYLPPLFEEGIIERVVKFNKRGGPKKDFGMKTQVRRLS